MSIKMTPNSVNQPAPRLTSRLTLFLGMVYSREYMREVLHFDAETNLVGKCTLCSHRIDQGLEPFCAVCCETEAMHFGDLSDPESEISKLVAARNACVLLPDVGTGPAVYYCPQMKPRGLP
jgi:Fe-S-cluster-containing dehydrogenase component